MLVNIRSIEYLNLVDHTIHRQPTTMTIRFIIAGQIVFSNNIFSH